MVTKAGKTVDGAAGAKAPKKPHGNAKLAWHVTRTQAWARWCRFEAEEALNGTSRLVLPEGKTLEAIRAYLVKRVKNPLINDTVDADETLARDLPGGKASKGERLQVSRDAMNGLLDGQAGTAWHKYERGTVGKLDPATVFKMDGWIPGARAFYDVGPHGVPIWALMGGVLTVDDCWLPILHYREGPTDAHRRTADLLELDVLPVGEHPDPDGRPAVPRALADKPAHQRSAADWRVIDEAMSASLRIGARIMSEYTPQQWRHAIQAGYSVDFPKIEPAEKEKPKESAQTAPAPTGKAGPKPKPAIKGPDAPGASRAAYAAQVQAQTEEPTREARDRTEQERGTPPEDDGFMIGDVLVLAVAALIHAGAKSTGDYAWNHPETGWLEDDVFVSLRDRRRLFEAFGELGFFRDDMNAWLDTLWAGYLDRNGYDTEPTEEEIDAKRAAYARLVEEENAASANTRPSDDLRVQALAKRKKPSTVRVD